MKRYLIIIVMGLMCAGSFASKVQVYLGLRGGAGVTVNHYRFVDMPTTGQATAIIKGNNFAWTAHAKGELLFGVWRFRVGYRFMYNYTAPLLYKGSSDPTVDANRNTTYFNSTQTHYFGHYLILELAIINRPHFGLVPGIAVGTYGGYKVDNSTGDKVWYRTDTHDRFSVGAELNAEIKFGRVVILAGPGYYLFSMKDKGNNNWRNNQHVLCADIGLRVNLLKPSDNSNGDKHKGDGGTR